MLGQERGAAAWAMGCGAAGVGLHIHRAGNPTAPSKEKERKQTWFPASSRHALPGRWAAGWQRLGRRFPGELLAPVPARLGGGGCQRGPPA